MKPHKSIASMFGYELLGKKQIQHLTPESHLQILMENLDINIFLDVGANIGDLAYRLRQSGYGGRIVSFEPVKSNYTQLERMASSDPDWETFNIALGAEESTQTINITKTPKFASFYTPNQFSRQRFGNSQMTIQSTEEVTVRRLDNIYREIVDDSAPQRVFLKLDTQGNDLNVFLGAAGILDRISGLQSELSVQKIYDDIPDYIEVLQTYRSHGFEMTGLYPVSRDHDSLVIIEFDCFLRRRPSGS